MNASISIADGSSEDVAVWTGKLTEVVKLPLFPPFAGTLVLDLAGQFCFGDLSGISGDSKILILFLFFTD